MPADTRDLKAGEFGVEVKREIAVWFVPTGGEAQFVTLPYPHNGYGGHEIVVSKNEKYVALWLYSGQSEVGYELFEVAPKLRHLTSLPYQLGEGDAPKFSPDAQYLVMLARTHDYAWVNEEGEEFDDLADADDDDIDDDEEDEEDPDDEDGEDDAPEGPWRLAWATLFVQKLPKGKIRQIPVEIEADEPPSEDTLHDWTAYDRLTRVDNDGATITTPWGRKHKVAFADTAASFDYSPKRKR